MTAIAAPSLQFVLNGRDVSLDASALQRPLLDVLRSRGLTGAKEGCAEGECGACAVAIVGDHGAGSAYRVVNSCLLPVALVADREVYTVEALAQAGQLAPAQQAMVAAGGSQCGYCTPGFVMSLFAEQYRPDRTGPCDPLALSGNLCRCTGYRPIADAASSLGAPPQGALLDRLTKAAPRLSSIAVPGFARPTTVDACVSALASDPEATLIAGATDLGVEANLRGRRWRSLISIEAIDELRTFSESGNAVTIGAALPLSALGRLWASAPAVIHEWLELFASPLIRNRATLGGNLATASPIGDSAPLLLALDARVHIAGPSGRRVVPLSSFFLDYRKTALTRGDLLVAIEIPKPLPSRVRFYKIAKRRLDDISTVAAAFALDVDRSGVVTALRLAYGGVAKTPVRVIDAESVAIGQPWDEATVERIQKALGTLLTPIGDHRGSREYRIAVSKSLVAKFHAEAQR